MRRFERLRAATSLAQFASILNYTPKGLTYVLYRLPAEGRYRTFTISKKGGGERIIRAPRPELKTLQRRVADLLLECVQEIEDQHPERRLISHGFQKGRSIITNADAHTRRRYVLNLDLKDFFHSINFGRVRGYLIRDRNFELNPKIATIIAQISCHDNSLPQGAPTSPVISNLIGHILDVRLVRLASKTGCNYTRYADDISLSTNQREFPRSIARRSRLRSNKWVLTRKFKDEIRKAGFSINPTKTRMQIRGSRQEVTGLSVNEKVNVPQEYYRNVRSMCAALFSKGRYFTEKTQNGDGTESPNWTDNLSPLEGRLGHIHYVKNRRDRSDADKKLDGFTPPEAPRNLYRQFLIFKYFIVSDVPVIVTEGKTDIT